MSPHTHKIKGQRCSQHLDLLRGAAALTVLMGHARNLFFVDYGSVTRSGPLVRAVYFATGFGHQAVMLFFVLSGFFIAGSVLRAYDDRSWSWQGYLVDRLSRLQVVLVPALLLCALWDSLGTHLFGSHSIYGNDAHGANVGVGHVYSRLTAGVFLGNVLFLQGIGGMPTFGSNGPLWSLSYEFWYYILFPVIVFAFSCRNSQSARLLYLIAALTIVAAIGGTMAIYFLVWLMGAAVVYLPRVVTSRNRQIIRACQYIAALLFVGTLVLGRTRILRTDLAGDFAVGASSTLLVYALLHDVSHGRRSSYGTLTGWLARFSYTLYLVHLPLLIFLQAYLIRTTRWQPDSYHAVLGAAICTAAVAYAYVISLGTEARTGQIRTLIHTSTLRLRPTPEGHRSEPRAADSL